MDRKDFSGVTSRIGEQEKQLSSEREFERRHLISLRSQFDAIARGDMDAVLANASPDVELDIFAPPEFKWIARARGIEELRRAIGENFASVEDQRPEVLNIVAQGDTVVLFGRETGRIRATGQPYDLEFVEKFTFRDEQLAAVRIIAAKRVQS